MKIKININIKIEFILFFVGLLFLQISNICVNVIFLRSYLSIIKMLGMIFLLICCLLKLTYVKVDRKKWILLIVLFIISIISYIKLKTTFFIEFLLIIFSAYKLEFNLIVKMDCAIKLCIILSMLVFSYSNLAQSEFYVVREGNIRNSLGFYHPNTLAMYIMMTFFEFAYLIYTSSKKNKKIILMGIIIMLLVNAITGSRSTVISIGFMLVLIYFEPLLFNGKNGSKIKILIAKNLYIILLLMTILISYIYTTNSNFLVSINKLMAGRIDIQNYYLREYGITLFGNNLEYVRTLDNAYLKTLLSYGIIVSIIYVYIYNCIIKKSLKEENKFIIYVFIIVAIYSMSESYLLNLIYNIFWLYYLSKENKRSKNNEV